MADDNTRLGIGLMVLTMMVFATQDGLSRHLAGEYNVIMIVAIRYWFFGAFVLALTMRQPGGVWAVAASRIQWLQVFRGIILAVEICVMVYAFTLLGLVESHAVFASYPLIVAALSGVVLGERVGWRRWSAIAIGFAGVLVILDPGGQVLSLAAIVPLISAALFALYALLTRYAGRIDSAATSFFWTGIAGAVAITPLGLWTWEPMSGADWGWMGLLCISGALGHWLLIRAYEVAEASAIQPFSFLHLVFAAAVGILVFGETLETHTALGGAVVLGAAIFTVWREGKTLRKTG